MLINQSLLFWNCLDTNYQILTALLTVGWLHCPDPKKIFFFLLLAQWEDLNV